MEAFLDALAKILSTNALSSVVTWILGDVGMAAPPQLPFGYIAPLNDAVSPYTGGPQGVDMDTYTIPLLIVQDVHDYQAAPIPGAPPGGGTVQYQEQPQYRALLELVQNIRTVLRANITMQGSVATCTVTEIRYLLVDIDDKPYRACRITIRAQHRRGRTG